MWDWIHLCWRKKILIVLNSHKEQEKTRTVSENIITNALIRNNTIFPNVSNNKHKCIRNHGPWCVTVVIRRLSRKWRMRWTSWCPVTLWPHRCPPKTSPSPGRSQDGYSRRTKLWGLYHYGILLIQRSRGMTFHVFFLFISLIVMVQWYYYTWQSLVKVQRQFLAQIVVL